MNYHVKVLEDPIIQNTYLLFFRHGNYTPLLMLSVYEWNTLKDQVEGYLKEIEKQNQ